MKGAVSGEGGCHYGFTMSIVSDVTLDIMGVYSLGFESGDGVLKDGFSSARYDDLGTM